MAKCSVCGEWYDPEIVLEHLVRKYDELDDDTIEEYAGGMCESCALSELAGCEEVGNRMFEFLDED